MKHVHIIAAVCCLAIGPTLAGEVDQSRPDSGQTVEYNVGIHIDKEPVETAPEGKASKIIVASATWCAPCQAMKPALKRLKREGYKVEVYSLDTDRHAELFTKRYANVKKEEGDKVNQWTQYPTIFYVEDGMIIKKDVGRKTRNEILKTLWKPGATPTTWDKLFDGIEARLPWKN